MDIHFKRHQEDLIVEARRLAQDMKIHKKQTKQKQEAEAAAAAAAASTQQQPPHHRQQQQQPPQPSEPASASLPVMEFPAGTSSELADSPSVLVATDSNSSTTTQSC